MEKNKYVLSTLGHTWIIDLDGTIMKHNGYKIDGTDTLLDGAKHFLTNIPAKDMIIFLTSRSEDYRETTENFLKDCNITYSHIIFGAPLGERIVLNDEKPSGLKMSWAINKKRDCSFFPTIDEEDQL